MKVYYLVGWLLSLLLVFVGMAQFYSARIESLNHSIEIARDMSRIEICEYAVGKKNNLVLSTATTGDQNIEQIQCAGEGKILRDKADVLQNFTFWFPKGRYNVKITDAPNGKITNVIFLHK